MKTSFRNIKFCTANLSDRLSSKFHLVRLTSFVHEAPAGVKPILTGLIFVTVVQELDAVKRSENGARNAIRWLEREFKEGKNLC